MARRTEEFPEYPEADRADDCPHPRHVFDLMGHELAEQRLADSLSHNRLHHAWLLTGPKGVGKATLAYRFIRRILGGQPNTEGRLDIPEDDTAARRISSLGHGDFLLLRRPYDQKTKKLKSEIVVSELKKIHEFYSTKASENGYRVCLIDSADDMNRSAANAVLKILEEPPDKAVIILLSSEPGKLLPTIRSRCLNIKLRPVEPNGIATWLGRQGVTEQTAQLAAQLSRGAPGRAFALAQADKDVLKPLASWLSTLPRSGAMSAHELAQTLSGKTRENARALFWDALTDIIALQARYAATGEWEGALKPISISRAPEAWTQLWEDLQVLRAREQGLNMESHSVMLSAISAVENGGRISA